jgi:quercetin dioxygenase-like cupin family protein
MTIRMLRITLEPGASTPMHTHPGPEFDIIESGDLTIRTEGDATVTRANGDTEAATEEEQVLAAGDWIVYQPGTGMFYENASEENVVLLSAVLLPVGAEFPESITYTDGQPTSRDFDGVSFTVLGDGLVQQMPSGPATVSIDSVVLPAGADLPAAEGVAMYSQVEGNFSFIVDSGAVQVSRSELQSLQPNAVTGEEFILEPGDAAFFPAGVTATSRADETGSLEMISLTVSFDEAMNRDAAELTFTTGSSATGDATGGAETPDTAETDDAESGVIGTIVTTNVADLNMRAEPSTEADVVDQLALGIELEVIGGPEEAEEYTWYQVQVTSEGGSSGWVAADFLDGLEGATPEETPAPEAASTPAAEASGTFAPGDIVATIDDSVRVRSEGNLGGDIVNAYPTGTEFEITGEPVDADDFTWYPVTLVENPDITGWIPADFIAPAE